MSDKDFVVKNGLVVNSTFIANSTQIAFGTINSTSTGFYANATTILLGNSSVNTSINSTAFSGVANNATNLGGIAAANYLQTTATAADSNKLGGVVAANYLTNTGTFTISGIHTHNANLVLATAVGISANSSYGIANQVLTTNGSVVYWGTPALSANINGGTGALQYYNGSILGSTAGLVFTPASNTITIGNTNVSATINSTSYTGSSNSTTYFGGLTYTSYVNSASLTSNLANYVTSTSLNSTLSGYLTTSGTAADSNKLGGTAAANYITNSSNFTIGGALTFNNLSTFVGAISTSNTISANASTGAAGQVLTSGGINNVYWSTVPNVAAQYTWTNNQSFTNTVTISGAIITSNSVTANGGVGTSGYVLTSGGALSNVYWGPVIGANTAGGTGGVQYYNGTNLGSAVGLTWAAASATLTISNTISIGTATINSTSYTGTSANATNLNGLAASAYVKGTDTFFIGTTSVSHTRTSAALALTGVSIDGNAGNITGTYGGTITSSQVTSGLGYTPYNSTNPAGYTTNLGTVTSVTATAPLASTGGTTPAISISQASGIASGYLSSTDWNTFNNKQAPLAAANASASGYLTSADWNTFNNKQAALGFTAAPLASPTFTGTVTIPAGASISGYVTTGTLSSYPLKTDVHYVGTTSIALNRASASQSLTGVSIDGSAATFTSTTQNSQFNSIGIGTAASATAGEIRAKNNITATTRITPTIKRVFLLKGCLSFI